MFRRSTYGSLGGMLYPWRRWLAGNGGEIPPTNCIAPQLSSSEPQAEPDRTAVLSVPPAIERLHTKYRGFRRMLRCLTMDPAVARLAVGGPRPVQFRPLC
jgi:hypothetical protein